MTLGGVAATVEQVSTDGTKLTVRASAAAQPGMGDVVVVSIKHGTTTLYDAYTYNKAGEINLIEPDNGPLNGGRSITINGIRLGSGTDITNVIIKGVTAEIQSQLDSEVVVIIGDADALGVNAGLGDVMVQSVSRGTTINRDAFLYNPKGVISAVSPSEGRSSGGELITIDGSNLGNLQNENIEWVTLCGVNASIVEGASDENIVIKSGSINATEVGAIGDVVVFSPSHGKTTLQDGFKYYPQGITNVSQYSASMAGSNLIEISGINLGQTVRRDEIAKQFQAGDKLEVKVLSAE
ncbi:MAG: hypothetical protein EOL87_17770 [Spartobacteria bacterium]|nr:hypothetical protein [Spartobacteria bacterium]